MWTNISAIERNLETKINSKSNTRGQSGIDEYVGRIWTCE